MLIIDMGGIIDIGGTNGRSDALETGQRLDVLAEGEQVEGGEAREAQRALGRERRGILDQGFEPAAHVQQARGRRAAKTLHER